MHPVVQRLKESGRASRLQRQKMVGAEALAGSEIDRAGTGDDEEVCHLRPLPQYQRDSLCIRARFPWLCRRTRAQMCSHR